MRVTPRFVTSINAWREDEETDDLYSYLESSKLRAALNEEVQDGEEDLDAAAAAAYAAVAPPRRLHQPAEPLEIRSFPPLLPERRKKAKAGGTRRLDVCPEEFTEKDEKRREKILKKAGFNSEMECDVETGTKVIRTREPRENEKLQLLELPPQYLPPDSPGCKGDALCGKQYCSFVDCTSGKFVSCSASRLLSFPSC